MRKVSKLFLLISLSFLLTFNSCNNVFENSVSSEENTSVQNNGSQTGDNTRPAGNTPSGELPAKIVFGGSLQLNGAVPAEAHQPEEGAENQQNGRSANAELPGTTDYEYYVTATSNDGLVREDVIPAASTNKNYTLQLETNKTWTFTAGYRKKASGTPGTDSYVAPKNLLIDIDTDSGHPYSLSLTDTRLQPAEAKTFILKPLQNGRGTIDLTMTVPTGIDDLKLFTSGENGVLTPWQIDALDVTTTTIKTKENMTIASGSYDVTMIFYSGEFQAYITYQTINVFDNMETKVWESGNAPGTESIISGGSFQLTTSLVQKFASSTIYVGAPEGVTVEPDDSRVGSPYAPVKTLNRAFEIIKANTSGDGNTRDYRILVTTAKPTAEKAAQPQKANLEIPDTITSAQAKSIEIIGQGSGANLAVLEPAAGNSAGTILTVNTTVPVTLRNIKLAGGKGSGGKGGALSITKNSAKVTIESGTVISDNSASDQGGGIYIQGTDASHKPKLIIKAGAEIKSNSIDNGGTGGMAIFAECAEVEMTGGEISGNNKAGAQYGAVRLTGAAEFTMTGGSVANNDGGAFYVDSDYDAGTSTYIQSKLKIGGSASIPYGVSGTASQQKNDVFVKHAGPDGGGKYSPVYIETSGLNLQTSSKIALTPEGWQRGLEILEAESGTIESYKDYFQLTDGDFNFSKSGSNVLFAKLKAPIYIKADGSDSPGASGTKSAPYRTLQHATASLAGGEEDTILIIGSVPAQVVSSTLTSDKCSALTIKGTVDEANPSAAPEIDANGANTSALSLSTLVPVTIENLKITGGLGTTESSSSYGGGIYLQTGTLKLGDGVQVTGNRAKYGGGVYVKKDTKLFMYGSALIGDSLDTPATGETGCANYSSADGGGIYNAGSIYLGYKGIEEGNPVPETLTGGVKRNASYYGGGGINNKGSSSSEKSNLKINSGYISYNKASCVTDSSENSGSPGGGIQNYQSNIEISGGEISYNEANSGGGVSVTAYVSAVFSGGTVKENKAASHGGGITVSDSSDTSFIISGSASVPYGVTESGTLVKAPCKNDVHLASMYGSGNSISSYAVLKVGSNLTASGNVAAITLEHWRRGLQFLGVDGALTALDDTIIGKFDFTDKGWDKKKYTKTTTNDAAKIDADIYVAGSNPAKCKTSDGASAPTDTDNTIGNWAHPFASISAALSSGLLDASHDTIIVDGSVSSAQSISGTGSLSAVAIKGYKAADATSSSAKIDAGGTSGAGSALTVNADGKTVTIQDLTITGGNATDGGGINITKGSVALGTGAKVTGNIASEFGGGVYLSGSDAKLFMYDSSLIGDDAASTTIATDGTSAGPATFANKAVKHGGGIYNNGGAVYIGYSGLSGGSPVKSDMTNGGGVRRNISTTREYHAGGILNRNGGTVRIASGSISYNFSTTHGGGLYNNNDAGEVLIEAPQNAANKAVFEGNHAKGNGGAIFNKSTLSMSAGQIGGSTSGLQNTVDSGAKGGAIFQDGSFTISGSAVVYAGSETVNDVCLGTIDRTIAVGSLSGSGTVASITPASWSRGTNILSSSSALSDAVKARFSLTKDDASWERKDNTAFTTKYVYITSPIYVVGASGTGSTKPDGFEYGKTSGANGTKTSPYASIADALTCADLATVKEIIIAGTLVGAQQVISSPSVDITLKGYKAAGETTSSAKIQRFSTRYTTNKTDGSALTVNASGKTVTITDLTITYGAALSGAGIYITAGTVKLGDYAKINDNYAANAGGGVYVNTGATLFMYGKSLIGDKLSTDAGIQVAGTDGSDDYANRAQQTGGGGIYNGGAAYIGYSGFGTDGTTLIASSIDNGYGIIRNYNANTGGGAIYNAGTLKIRSGSISYNQGNNGGAIKCAADATISGGTFTANKALYGGAICVDASKTVTINGSATFTKNQASSSGGGAIYNAGTLTMSAGTIGEDGALNTAETSGGAIYQGGTFNISASAYVYPGSEKSNDVYLSTANTRTVTIAGAFTTGSNNSSSKMTITQNNWTRGSAVITAGSGVTIDDDKLNCFKLSDQDWTILNTASGSSTAKGVINAPVYVACANSTDGLNLCTGTGDDTNGNGSRAKPYASISKALSEAWDTSKKSDLTIKIDGEVKGAQTISGTINARRVIVIGASSSYYTKPSVLNGGFDSGSPGTTLTVTTSTPVFLNRITIKGGYNAGGNGGGLSVSGSASIVDMQCAWIEGNYAINGGGVYVASGCSFYFEDYGCIGSSDANLTVNQIDATTGLTRGVNKAYNYGAGVYNQGTFYMGYTYNITNGTPEDVSWDGDLNPLVTKNYCYNNGGGVCTVGSMKMSAGKVSINKAPNGSGIYVKTSEGNSMTLCGGTISSNRGDSGQGGGMYVDNGASVIVESGGDGVGPIISGNTAKSGGGVYVAANGSFEIKNNSPMYIYGNISSDGSTSGGGGGVYVANNGIFEMRYGWIGRDENGSINPNFKTRSGKGNGVYIGGTGSQFNMSHEAHVDVTNDVYVPSGAFIGVRWNTTGFLADPPPAIITPATYSPSWIIVKDVDEDQFTWSISNFKVTPNGDQNYKIQAGGSNTGYFVPQ